MGFRQTLCFSCAKASGKYGGCSWEAGFIPVEGWEAEPTSRRFYSDDHYTVDDSYLVIKCPLYLSDDDAKNINEEEYILKLND